MKKICEKNVSYFLLLVFFFFCFLSLQNHELDIFRYTKAFLDHPAKSGAKTRNPWSRLLSKN